MSPTIPNIINRTVTTPIHFFFHLHPLIFAIVFGAMGTVRYNKEQKIKEFVISLVNKNNELALANKKLRELDKLKSNFLSMVSHELRTPLTTIQGYVTHLLTEKVGVLNETQKEYLKTSEEEADLLNHLMEELLDLSRIERGEFKVNLECVNMRKIVSKAILSLQLLINNKKIILENCVLDNLPYVWADKEKILQVVTNLLENAIKFNREGGKIHISAFGYLKNNKAIFCIGDTGIGIQSDKLDKIFDKFYQADSSANRKYGGCGLGLAISKSILDSHHGRIWVESTVAVGTKFYFKLIKYDKTKSAYEKNSKSTPSENKRSNILETSPSL